MAAFASESMALNTSSNNTTVYLEPSHGQHDEDLIDYTDDEDGGVAPEIDYMLEDENLQTREETIHEDIRSDSGMIQQDDSNMEILVDDDEEMSDNFDTAVDLGSEVGISDKVDQHHHENTTQTAMEPHAIPKDTSTTTDTSQAGVTQVPESEEHQHSDNSPHQRSEIPSDNTISANHAVEHQASVSPVHSGTTEFREVHQTPLANVVNTEDSAETQATPSKSTLILEEHGPDNIKDHGDGRALYNDFEPGQAGETNPKHPVLVKYGPHAEESYLFSCSGNASPYFFFEDDSLASESISALLKACRSVVNVSGTDEHELELEIPSLALTIGEESAHATSTSFDELLDVYLGLYRLDGIDIPDPMTIVLTSKPRFSARLGFLRQAIADNVSFSRLMTYRDTLSATGTDHDARSAQDDGEFRETAHQPDDIQDLNDENIEGDEVAEDQSEVKDSQYLDNEETGDDAQYAGDSHSVDEVFYDDEGQDDDNVQHAESGHVTDDIPSAENEGSLNILQFPENEHGGDEVQYDKESYLVDDGAYENTDNAGEHGESGDRLVDDEGKDETHAYGTAEYEYEYDDDDNDRSGHEYRPDVAQHEDHQSPRQSDGDRSILDEEDYAQVEQAQTTSTAADIQGSQIAQETPNASLTAQDQNTGELHSNAEGAKLTDNFDNTFEAGQETGRVPPVDLSEQTSNLPVSLQTPQQSATNKISGGTDETPQLTHDEEEDLIDYSDDEYAVEDHPGQPSQSAVSASTADVGIGRDITKTPLNIENVDQNAQVAAQESDLEDEDDLRFDFEDSDGEVDLSGRNHDDNVSAKSPNDNITHDHEYQPDAGLGGNLAQLGSDAVLDNNTDKEHQQSTSGVARSSIPPPDQDDEIYWQVDEPVQVDEPIQVDEFYEVVSEVSQHSKATSLEVETAYEIDYTDDDEPVIPAQPSYQPGLSPQGKRSFMEHADGSDLDGSDSKRLRSN